jgi:phosphoesterase RecJ-like protein
MEPHAPREPVPEKLLEFIKEGKKFIVAGHKEPDGDCVGSQLALASVLRRMGKEAVLCSAGPFKRTEIKKYEQFFVSAPDIKGGERIIIVDCSALDRTGDLMSFLDGFPTAVIDHHEMGKFSEAADGNPFYLDGKSPSTTFLVYKVIEALGFKPNREEAELLFFGLCTDTGFFRHVDGEGAEVFDVAAALIRYGASPKDAFFAFHDGKSLDSRKLLGHILARAESLLDGKLILSTEEYEDSRRFGLAGRDTDSLYQLLQTIAGVEAVVIIRQETPQECTAGLRSRSWVDVGSIAKAFGGGGHRNASGFKHAGTIPELKPKIIEAFEQFL